MTTIEPLRSEITFVREARELLCSIADDVDPSVPAPAPASDFCASLEYLLPELLRRRYAPWKGESLDGVYVAGAVRRGPQSLLLSGICLLISDQTLAPFRFEAGWSAWEDRLLHYRLTLGEAGAGRLGISGPRFGSLDADRLLERMRDPDASVGWVFEIDAFDADATQISAPPTGSENVR